MNRGFLGVAWKCHLSNFLCPFEVGKTIWKTNRLQHSEHSWIVAYKVNQFICNYIFHIFYCYSIFNDGMYFFLFSVLHASEEKNDKRKYYLIVTYTDRKNRKLLKRKSCTMLALLAPLPHAWAFSSFFSSESIKCWWLACSAMHSVCICQHLFCSCFSAI
jgi:hypothetical protein